MLGNIKIEMAVVVIVGYGASHAPGAIPANACFLSNVLEAPVAEVLEQSIL